MICPKCGENTIYQRKKPMKFPEQVVIDVNEKEWSKMGYFDICQYIAQRIGSKSLLAVVEKTEPKSYRRRCYINGIPLVFEKTFLFALDNPAMDLTHCLTDAPGFSVPPFCCSPFDGWKVHGKEDSTYRPFKIQRGLMINDNIERILALARGWGIEVFGGGVCEKWLASQIPRCVWKVKVEHVYNDTWRVKESPSEPLEIGVKVKESDLYDTEEEAERAAGLRNPFERRIGFLLAKSAQGIVVPVEVALERVSDDGWRVIKCDSCPILTKLFDGSSDDKCVKKAFIYSTMEAGFDAIAKIYQGFACAQLTPFPSSGRCPA